MNPVRTTLTFTAVTAMLLASCSFAPDYHRPEMPIPEAYKEAPGEWQKADPEKAAQERGPWWQVYNDPTLNALEEKLLVANQDVKAAVARYDQARALLSVARASYFPAVNADAGASRQRFSQTAAELRASKPFNDFQFAGDVSYELDLWGRVRNRVKAGEGRAEASKAELAALRLSLQAELAMNYFSLRGLDQQQALVDQTVLAYEKALKLTQSRFQGGAAPQMDVDRADAQLQSARTLSADTRLKRAQLEHAIAVLTGEVASSFALPVQSGASVVPVLAPQLPSSLVEQRPDIAAAAARVEAANAEIGVARAAYFPTVSLGARGGVESAEMARLVQAPSLLWSFGPSLFMPLFDAGRIRALSEQAHAAYEETVAGYRQVVLQAFQQVEDQLAAMQQLALQNTTQTAAVQAAERALQQAGNRYAGGIATYLDVVQAQTTALQAELSLLDIRTRQLTASVMLTKAVGGTVAYASEMHASLPVLAPAPSASLAAPPPATEAR